MRWLDREDLARRVTRLQGVLACRASVDELGNLTDIRLVVRGDVDVHRIRQDVRSLLVAETGVDIGQELVRVAVVYGPGELVPGPRRVRILSTSVTRSLTPAGRTVTASVSLARQGDVSTGQAEGPWGADEARLAAEATYRALEQLLGVGPLFRVVRVEHCTGAPGPPAVLVAASVVPEPGPGDVYTGSAVVRWDPVDAAARAALGAVNRWVAFPERLHRR